MQKFDKYEKRGAYHYKWYDDPNFAWYKECVDRIVNFCKGETLDIGGGDGLVSSIIIENGFNSTVLDNEASAFAYLRKKGIPYHQTDLDEQEQSWIGIEYVCSLNVLEHLKSPQSHMDLIRQAHKGAIIITDKATKNKGRYHEHEYTKKELLETFKELNPKYFEINSTEFGKPITFIGVEIKK